jgi:hypothetical protein
MPQMVLPSFQAEICRSRSMSSGTPWPATMRSMMRCIQPMPSRHGVHWPQDSWW